ncbi:MAG: peptidylprolyl isomerase [Bacteroidia bacterium]
MKKIIFISTILFFCLNQETSAQQKKQTTKPQPKQEKKTVTDGKERVVEIITDYGSIVVVLYNETPKHRDNFIKLVQQKFYDSLLFHRVIKEFMIQGGDPQSKNAGSEQMLGSGDIGYKIDAEFVREKIHKRGALAAARDNNPLKQSSGCQFYIVQGRKFTLDELEKAMNNRNLNRKQELFYKYTQVDSVKTKLATYQHNEDKEGLRKYFDEMMNVVEAMYQASNPVVYTPKEIEIYMKEGGAPHLDGEYTVFGEVIIGLDVLDKIAEVQTGSADRPLQDVRMRMRILQ